MQEQKVLDKDNAFVWKYLNIAIIVCASILYLILASYKVFWYDEAYTVGMIFRDYSEIADITSNDVHSPFYYFILKFFYETIGMQSLSSVKLFSFVFLLMYLFVGGRYIRHCFNRKIECFWLILSCFMPSMVIQATSGRMYTFALFWVTLSAILVYSLFLQESRSKWIALVISTIIAIYIHTFSMIEMMVIYFSFIIAVLVKKRYQTFKRILLAGVIVACSYIPWLLVLWKQFSRWAGWESGWSNTIAEFSVDSVKSYLAEWFSAIENPQTVSIVFGVALFILAGLYAITYMKEEKKLLPALGLIVSLFVLGIAIAVSVLIVPCFLGRYLFPMAGTVWVFVAVGMYRMRRPWIQVALIVGILLCGGYVYNEELKLEDENGLEAYLSYIDSEWEEGDIIMADSYFTLMMTIYAPEKDYMIYGGMARGIPFGNCEAFTAWEQLEGVNTVWYLSFRNFRIGNLDEKYDRVEVLDIPFSYYDIVLERCDVRE